MQVLSSGVLNGWKGILDPCWREGRRDGGLGRASALEGTGTGDHRAGANGLLSLPPLYRPYSVVRSSGR